MGKSVEERAEERARKREERKRKKALKKAEKDGLSAGRPEIPEQELLDAIREDRDAESGRNRGFRSIVSTQQAMPILDVRDDIVILKDGTFVKLMEFSPINFELRSPTEQDAIIAQFGSVIRTWPKNVHIKVVSTPSNVSDFIDELNSCMERKAARNAKSFSWTKLKCWKESAKRRVRQDVFLYRFRLRKREGSGRRRAFVR